MDFFNQGQGGGGGVEGPFGGGGGLTSQRGGGGRPPVDTMKEHLYTKLGELDHFPGNA